MAHYEIKSINDSKSNSSVNGSLPREGFVNEVCSEWLLHEDQALAYRLQNEEYQHHFGHNRQRNAILRKDTPKAKEEQLKEDEEAARAQTQLEIELARQEARDAAIAAAIGRELDNQEKEEKRIQELRDQELAKKLLVGEKTKVRQMREMRQVEREAAYLGINSGLDNVAILSRKDKRSKEPEVEVTQCNRAASPNSDDLTDLSDFCLKPSSSMDEEEMRRLQEDQDEELARLLQEQDLKRRGDLLQEDQLLAIEAQDKELAKVLQEQERAKAKKNREKARQKALLKQQQRLSMADKEQPPDQHPPPRPPKLLTPPPRKDSPDQFEFSHYATITTTSSSPPRRSHSPQYATPMLVQRSPEARSGEGGRKSLSPTGRGGNPRLEREISEVERPLTLTTPSPTFSNIACAIDPTYQRRVRQGEIPPSPSLPPPNPSPSPGPSKAPPVSPPVFDDDDDYLPPPYMPIQGQRRTASLEKRSPGQKPSKEKPDKNGCKQQ